jgi:RNA polymerase sigma-70 factor, ECF subfamily
MTEQSGADSAMERYAQGDDSAFEELYDILSPRLLAFLMARTHDDSLSRDLMQATFLSIHRARGRFVAGALVMPWAFTIAANALRDHRKATRSRPCSSCNVDNDRQSDIRADSDAPDDWIDACELGLALEQELQCMPSSQRETFELVHDRGLTNAEAATLLGVSTLAVRLRMHRVYKSLRSVFARRLTPGQ